MEVVHCNDLTTLLSGYLIKVKNKKIKLIFDSHELYPETYTGLMKDILKKYQKVLIKKIDIIILPEINRINFVKKEYNIFEKKIKKIENFPLRIIDTKKDYFFRKYNYYKNKKIGLYIGMISENRGVLEIIKSIEATKNIDFFCIGKFINIEYKNEIFKYIREKKIENRIFIKEAIPQEEVMEATLSADISFIFYQNINLNNYYCASNKLYECLNSGLKIITNDYPGILEVTKGIPNVYNVKEVNTDEIKKGIEILLKEEKIIKTNYYWENQEEEFIKIYS